MLRLQLMMRIAYVGEVRLQGRLRPVHNRHAKQVGIITIPVIKAALHLSDERPLKVHVPGVGILTGHLKTAQLFHLKQLHAKTGPRALLPHKTVNLIDGLDPHLRGEIILINALRLQASSNHAGIPRHGTYRPIV